MNQRNWFQISGQLIEAYKISDLSVKLKNLPLSYFYTTAAPFSGPIAILYNKFLDEQYKFPQGYDKSVLIFNCKGQLKKSVPYQLKDRVILFKFTQLEQLLIVYANGTYALIDLFSSHINQSTYFTANAVNMQKQRCVGADMIKDTLFIIKQRQLGFVKSVKGQWECLPFVKIGFQNPVFSMESDQFKNISIVYLTKDATIECFSLLTNSKKVIFSHQYLTTNWKKLTTISKNNQKMCLIFKEPYKLFYIDLGSNPMPNDKKIRIHQPLLDLKSESQINKKKSIHNYKSMNSQVCWMDKFAFYCNKKMTVIFDDQSQKVIFKTTIIISQVDGIRIMGQQTTLYRIVNHLYQQLVSYESFQQNQRNIVHNYVNQNDQIDYLKVGVQDLTIQIKLKIVHQLHKIYQKFVNQQIIQLEQLSKFKHIVGDIFKQIVENGIKCLDKLQLIKILKFSTFLQNYFIPQKYIKSQIKPQSQSQINLQTNIQKQYQKDESFEGISICLLTPINELCYQLRIINQLKYSYLQRFLTIQQFHYLKENQKDVFVKIFLKYNMHYELDLIFGDTQTKQKIFYHWMKCKIQKWESQNSSKSAKYSENQNYPQLSAGNSQDQLVQQIMDRYSQLKKNLTSTIIFSQISKYCVDRDKLSLALKLIQYQQHTERRIIVGLLILVAKKDKNMIPKIIQFTELSKQSSIIYRVIKELLSFNWIEKHLWVNILNNKPNFKQHYLKYLNYLDDQDLIKSFYLQNKLFLDLGYHKIKGQLWTCFIKKKQQLKKGDSQYEEKDIYQLNNQQTELLKTSIIDSSKQLISSLATNMKKYKKRTSVQLLKNIKNKKEPINEKDLQDFKSDLDNQYLGQIILTKDKNQNLAVKVFSKIKSDKCYSILMKIGRFNQAIDLAFTRRNKEKLTQIIDLNQDSSNYCKLKLAQLDRKK